MNFGSLLSTTEQRHTFNTERLQAQLLGNTNTCIDTHLPRAETLSDDNSKAHWWGFSSVSLTGPTEPSKLNNLMKNSVRLEHPSSIKHEQNVIFLEKTSPQLENFGFNDSTQTLINSLVRRVEMSAAIFHNKTSSSLTFWQQVSQIKKFQPAKKISKLLWLDPNWTGQLWLKIQVKSLWLKIRVLLPHLTLKQPFYSAASNSNWWSTGECKCCGCSADLQIFLTAINCC